MRVKLLTIALITVLLLAWLPLMYSNFERCETQIFPFKGSYVGSQGHVQRIDSQLVTGDLNYENDSQATYQFIIRVLPFMGEVMKNSTEPYMVIVGDYPVTSTQPYIQLAGVGWEDDAFGEGWVDAQGGDNAMVDDGILEVYKEFTAGTRSFYLLRKDLPAINSSEYPFVVVRWRSTDHVARFCVFDSEEGEYKIIVETEAGIIQFPAIDYGGGYSSSWTTTFYELPPNKTITSMDLGVDSGAWGITELGGEHPISGEQHAYFDYVMFAQGQIEGSHVTVKLNNNTIFDEKLTYSKGELYSLDFTKYLSPELEFSFDTSLPETENLLDITVDKRTSWNISSVTILLKIGTPYLPVWRTVPGHMPLMFFALGLEVVIVLVLSEKLRKWIATF